MAPPVLIVLLSRFDENLTNKIETLVEFPLELDMNLLTHGQDLSVGAGFSGPPQKSKMEGEVNIRICIIANIFLLFPFQPLR